MSPEEELQRQEPQPLGYVRDVTIKLLETSFSQPVFEQGETRPLLNYGLPRERVKVTLKLEFFHERLPPGFNQGAFLVDLKSMLVHSADGSVHLGTLGVILTEEHPLRALSPIEVEEVQDVGSER